MNKDIIREPLLRFPGFDDEWKKDRLGNVTNFKNGYAFKPDSMLSKKQDNALPIITIKNLIHSSYINTRGIKYHIYNDDLSKFIIKGENILIAMSGATVGKISLTNKESTFYQNQRVGRMEVNDKSRMYIYNYLISEMTQSRIEILSIGTGQPNISTSDIKNLKISLPSLEEQSKIGSFFKTLDSFIEKQESYIEKLENEKKGLLQDIFSRDLRLLDEYGERFEDEWKEVKLGEVSLRKSSKRTISKSNKDKNEKHSYPLFNASGVVGYTKDFDVSRSIAVCKDGTVGEVFFIDNEASVVATIDYILNKDGIDLYFLYLAIKRIDFRIYSVGTSIKHIYYSDYKNHNIQLPSLPEQKAIGLFFKKIDEKIEKERELLEKYNEMKKGLLQDMFI